MADTRKLPAILAADGVGYSKLAGADEERTLARLRALRSDLIDPSIALHHGRVFNRHSAHDRRQRLTWVTRAQVWANLIVDAGDHGPVQSNGICLLEFVIH